MPQAVVTDYTSDYTDKDCTSDCTDDIALQNSNDYPFFKSFFFGLLHSLVI